MSELPSIWRAARAPLLAIALPLLAFGGLITYASAPPWTGWPVFLLAILVSLAFLQAEWRIQRAIGVFADAFGPPDEAKIDPSSDQVAAWADEGITVRGSTRMFTVFRLHAEVGDDVFPFPPRKAKEAVQRVQAHVKPEKAPPATGSPVGE